MVIFGHSQQQQQCHNKTMSLSEGSQKSLRNSRNLASSVVIQVALPISERIFKDPLMQYFCHKQNSWCFPATKNIKENIKSYDSLKHNFCISEYFVYHCFCAKWMRCPERTFENIQVQKTPSNTDIPSPAKGNGMHTPLDRSKTMVLCANRNQPHLHYSTSSQHIPFGVKGFGNKGNNVSWPG